MKTASEKRKTMHRKFFAAEDAARDAADETEAIASTAAKSADDAWYAWNSIRTANEKEARLYACDFAERFLRIFEAYYPDDNRFRQYIETARKYALKKATEEDFHEIARKYALGEATQKGEISPTELAVEAARAAVGDTDRGEFRDTILDSVWHAAKIAVGIAVSVEKNIWGTNQVFRDEELTHGQKLLFTKHY